MAGGRPTEYTEELAADFCSRIALGNSLRRVCSDPDMPSHQTVYNWFNKYPEFLEQYARAKDDSADSDADKIEEIAEMVLDGSIEPQQGRVAMDAYKWTAGKKKPKKYGDRQQIDQTTTHRFESMTDEDLEARLKSLTS